VLLELLVLRLNLLLMNVVSGGAEQIQVLLLLLPLLLRLLLYLLELLLLKLLIREYLRRT
jgi:hypothetical protein